MKKRNFFFSAAPVLGAVVLACGLAVGAATPRKAEVKPVHAQAAAEQADLARFKLRYVVGTGASLSATASKLTYTGGWNSNFAVTDQFNTLSKSYSLKAHIEAPTWVNGGDDYFGAAIYYDADNYITFLLKWNNDCATSIADGVWLNKVNGSTNGVYASAKQGGAWEDRGEFLDVWTDWSGWSETQDGANVNLRDNSRILLNEGFDLTLNVDRVTHLGRLGDKISVKIDATAADGVTPKSFYSPSYIVDAATNPKGTGELKFATINPQIGYVTNKSNIEISDVEFTDNAAVQHNAKFETIGENMACDVRVDLDRNALAYRSNALFADYAFTFDLPTASDETLVFSADLDGTSGITADTGVGFFYWLDNLNYVMMYVKWDGTRNAPAEVVTVAVVNGNNGGDIAAAQIARDPWDPYADKGFWTSHFSDYSGFATDAGYVCGYDGNFNSMRSETDTVTLQTGFNLALIRARRTYASRLADTFQIKITGNGLDGKVHNWYTPIYAFDGFTYPKGAAEASAAINKAPVLGFLNYNVGTVEYSNIRFNGGEVQVDLTDRQYVRNFSKDALEMNTIPTTDHSDTGHCRAVWTSVKTAYNALTADQKALLMTDVEFADAKARLEAWATANGETINSTTYIIASNPTSKTFDDSNINKGNNAILIVCVIAAISVASLLVLVLLKKKLHK